MTIDSPESRVSDFDFIIGSWNVHHRRLDERLSGCTHWTEFEGTSTTRKVLGEAGNLEDNVLAMPDETYHAVALRSFDTHTQEWSIWWLDGRNPGRLDPPVVGKFANGTGLFFANDVLNGRPIRVRFTWSIPEPDRPRWEQAFSDDDGASWETNWTMTFERPLR
ncbi:MAG: DUF1579 domain-containing protein [Thermoanaerobaculia bacterium]